MEPFRQRDLYCWPRQSRAAWLATAATGRRHLTAAHTWCLQSPLLPRALSSSHRACAAAPGRLQGPQRPAYGCGCLQALCCGGGLEAVGSKKVAVVVVCSRCGVMVAVALSLLRLVKYTCLSCTAGQLHYRGRCLGWSCACTAFCSQRPHRQQAALVACRGLHTCALPLLLPLPLALLPSHPITWPCLCLCS